MTLYKQNPLEPAAWRVSLEGCNHIVTLSREQVHNSLVGDIYDPNTNSHKPQIVCPLCSQPTDVREKPISGDYCMQTVIKTVHDVTPLYNRQYSEELRKKQQEPKS